MTNINEKFYTMATTCRTCALNFSKADLIPIFTNKYRNKPIDFIHSFLTHNFKISENDHLPQNICKNCLSNFKIFKQFIIKCEIAENVLNYYFQKISKKNNRNKETLKNKNIEMKECSVRLKKIKTQTILETNTIIPGGHVNDWYQYDATELYESSHMDVNYTSSTNQPAKPYLSEIKFEPCIKEFDEFSDTAEEVTNSSPNEDLVKGEDLWEESSDDFKCSSDFIDYDFQIDSKLSRTKCNICNINFCETNYTRHMKRHQPLILTQCSICKKLVDDLQMHKFKKHKIKFHCTDCEEIFESRQKYTIHRFRKHEKPQHNCKVCNKSYIFLYRLRQHEQKCHSSDTNGICDICGKTFTNGGTLISHRATHIIERKINKNDIETKQMSSEINIFKCPYCSKSFRNLFGLKNHAKHHKKLKHSEEYKHVCEYCEQRFNRSDHLKLHLDLVHLKIFPFSCTYCSKKFPKQYILNQHVRKRHEETSHICQYCKKKYTLKVSLTRHIRSHHLMEKRYKCDICGEAFLTAIQCKKHMEIHTIEEERETAKRIYGEILNGL